MNWLASVIAPASTAAKGVLSKADALRSAAAGVAATTLFATVAGACTAAGLPAPLAYAVAAGAFAAATAYRLYHQEPAA